MSGASGQLRSYKILLSLQQQLLICFQLPFPSLDGYTCVHKLSLFPECSHLQESFPWSLHTPSLSFHSYFTIRSCFENFPTVVPLLFFAGMDACTNTYTETSQIKEKNRKCQHQDTICSESEEEHEVDPAASQPIEETSWAFHLVGKCSPLAFLELRAAGKQMPRQDTILCLPAFFGTLIAVFSQ